MSVAHPDYGYVKLLFYFETYLQAENGTPIRANDDDDDDNKQPVAKEIANEYNFL